MFAALHPPKPEARQRECQHNPRPPPVPCPVQVVESAQDTAATGQKIEPLLLTWPDPVFTSQKHRHNGGDSPGAFHHRSPHMGALPKTRGIASFRGGGRQVPSKMMGGHYFPFCACFSTWGAGF